MAAFSAQRSNWDDSPVEDTIMERASDQRSFLVDIASGQILTDQPSGFDS